MYLYPDNLKSKATMWLWQLRDLAVIGIGFLLSVFAAVEIGTLVPALGTAVYAFLTICVEEICILDFIRMAGAYFFGRQTYEWRKEEWPEKRKK